MDGLVIVNVVGRIGGGFLSSKRTQHAPVVVCMGLLGGVNGGWYLGELQHMSLGLRVEDDSLVHSLKKKISAINSHEREEQGT